MPTRLIHTLLACVALTAIISCNEKKISRQEEMVKILHKAQVDGMVGQNPLCPSAELIFVDSLIAEEKDPGELKYYAFMRAKVLLALGKEDDAIEAFANLVKGDEAKHSIEPVWKELALAYMRLGERSNCIINHASESCVIPIRGFGIHTAQGGSRKAIQIYEILLDRNPMDLESRWLLNLAYMTVGEYPKKVPAKFLIPGMEGDTTNAVRPFTDVAADLKLDVNNMAGGSIIEDFDNDGYLDLMTSGWGADEELHFFRNKGDGTFDDLSDKIGLKGITGGLNMTQADYNNDGFTDVLVLRGGWRRQYGKEPNSLLRNNGDGTFTDVTLESGMLSFHPTQTATWNDFNNDGWLDVFIGNESMTDGKSELHPSELYINNQDGTFREMARQANCEILRYVKGVASGDYDHDGLKDIFVSTISGARLLLKNTSRSEKEIAFTDVSESAGISGDQGNTFPTWFWDYDNDGWLDILAVDYTYNGTLGAYLAADKLKIPAGNREKFLLYHNNHNGTFTNLADSIGLKNSVFAMGSNFGDIDNDGFLDMYFGTGNPDYKSLIPNKMYRNLGGKKFVDVTTTARVGHLQKGHGVSFADMDNDGDQDVYIEMGGFYPGDAYQNAFYLNPGQSTNNWICLTLKGTRSNRSAIGTEVKLTFTENGKSRSVYRDVNSGGSFGCSPFRREIGIGQATVVDELEVKWHGSKEVQVFRNIKPNQFYKLVEGNKSLETVPLKIINWTLPEKLCIPEKPLKAGL